MTKGRPPENPRNTRSQEQPLTLAPLDFEEALRGLLEVAPPPKGERPEPEPGPEDRPKRKGRPKKADKDGRAGQ